MQEVQEGLKTIGLSLFAFGAALLVASVFYWNWKIFKIVRKIDVLTDDMIEQEELKKL